MKKLFLALTFICPLACFGQFVFTPFYLDSDTNSSFLTDKGHTSPYNFVIAGKKMFFSAKTETAGRELWITDGTDTGTFMVKDIAPGKADGCLSWNGGVLNNNYFFSAYNQISGEEPWVSDGTTTGTSLVKDIIPGMNGSISTSFVPVNNKMLFNALTIPTPIVCCRELYISDGTVAGTGILKQTHPTLGSSSISGPVAYNNMAYFTANDSVHGKELWVTDGTTAGTHIVKDMNPGLGSSSIGLLRQAIGKLFFTLIDTNGRELWVTDGTASGAHMVKDINPGPAIKEIALIDEYKGRLYFEASNDTCFRCLWVTDGTDNGTKVLLDSSNKKVQVNYPPIVSAIHNNKLYFVGGANSIYVTDGTSAGTYMVVDLNPRSAKQHKINYLTSYSDYLFFSETDTNGNAALWYSDGTASNTHSIKPPGSSITDPLHNNLGLAVFDSSLFLGAAFDINGTELWSLRDTVKYPIKGTGVGKNLKPTDNFAIYPNPAHDKFTIEVAAEQTNGAVLTVYDIAGKMIKKVDAREVVVTVDMAGCAPGMYIVQLQTSAGMVTRKLLIE